MAEIQDAAIAQKEGELAEARQHVVNGRRNITEQVERIAALRRDGHAVEQAEQVLATFAQTLALHEFHVWQLERELAELRPGKT